MIQTIEVTELDLEHPTSNPCCVCDCMNQPTFILDILVEDTYKGSVFICESHYNIGLKFPGQLLSISRTLTRLVRGN